MTQLDPISADWLALRERADDRARQGTVPTLLAALGRSGADAGGAPARAPLLCVDLGTGTGANPRWLMPRLPVPQTWLLVDHDEDLLAELASRLSAAAVPWEPVVSDVAHLAGVLARHRRPGQPVLITCAALLDLLDRDTVEDLARILRDEAAYGLFSLTVDGGGDLTPPTPLDGAVQEAFNAHQQRHGHLGPEAVPALGRALEEATGDGTVTVQRTDWELDAADPQDRALIERLLHDRVAAVRDQLARQEGTGGPDRTGGETESVGPALRLTGRDVENWLADRLESARRGALRVRVGHQDVLVTPGG